jgi:hypothetical protein
LPVLVLQELKTIFLNLASAGSDKDKKRGACGDSKITAQDHD